MQVAQEEKPHAIPVPFVPLNRPAADRRLMHRHTVIKLRAETSRTPQPGAMPFTAWHPHAAPQSKRGILHKNLSHAVSRNIVHCCKIYTFIYDNIHKTSPQYHSI